MKVFVKYLICFVFSGLFLCADAFSVVLSGNVSVNETSDTASDAKINATNGARRQILFNVLSQYSDKDEINELLNNSSNEDLANLISATSVSGEHISSTGYSANIKMDIDNDAVKKWLMANNVRNWVPSAESVEKFTAFIVISNGISDWAELNRITRAGNVDIETQSINGNQIIVKMPLNYRTKFTAAVREYGWRYTDNDGVLQVWK